MEVKIVRYSLQSQCTDFIYSREIIAENNKFENCYLIPVCANIFSCRNIEANLNKFKECRKILESEITQISYLRGNARLPLISMLSVSDNPEVKFSKAMEILSNLKKEIFQTEYLAILAMILTDIITVEDSDQYIRRGKEIFKNINKVYSFKTSEKDIVFAVLMAFPNKSDDELISEMIYFNNKMQNTFVCSNFVQSMSSVVTLVDGTIGEKCEKINYLYSSLKERKRNYGLFYELPVLGAAAMLPAYDSEVIEDIIEVDEYLSTQKSYGAWGVDNNSRRLMHAIMLVINDYSESNKINLASIAAITNTLAMISEIDAEKARTSALYNTRIRTQQERSGIDFTGI